MISSYDLKEVLKSYYLKNIMQNDCNTKTIDKFCFIIDLDRQYYVKKSIDTNDEHIKTRVIKFSVGHHLSFELIDE